MNEDHYDCHPHIVLADGTELKKLADRNGYRGVTKILDVPELHGGSSDTAVWSLDIEAVFYTVKVGANVELFTANLKGEIEQLTKSSEGTQHYHPQPSGDGKRLLYGCKQHGIRQLCVMHLSDRTEMTIA